MLAPEVRSRGPDDGSGSLVARYDQLIAALDRTMAEWTARDGAGRGADLQEAASVVFGLLYDLDYQHGGELVPRLAGIYAFMADELLSIGKTHDRARLGEVRRMVGALRAAV